MINYQQYYLKGKSKKNFFDWCIENKLHKRTTLKFTSRLQLVFTGFIETESITAIVAYKNKEVAAILLCENRIAYSKGKIYKDPTKFVPVEQETMNWGFYNLGILDIYVKPKFRKQGIAKEMIQRIERIRLKKLSNIHEDNWYESSMPLFEAHELTFEIGKKYFENSYVSTGKPENKYFYRQVVHNLTVKCKEKTSSKQFIMKDFKRLEILVEESFIQPVKIQRSKII